MYAFNSADVLPKGVGVPNMIPSAHSTSAWGQVITAYQRYQPSGLPRTES